MSDLDRHDLDDLYIGPCEACGEDVIVDPLLGETVRHIARQLVCEACWQDHAEAHQSWPYEEYSLRGNE